MLVVCKYFNDGQGATETDEQMFIVLRLIDFFPHYSRWLNPA